jgi:hypothetical protein
LDIFARGRTEVENPAFASTDPSNPAFLKPTASAYAIPLKSPAPGADPNVGAIAP